MKNPGNTAADPAAARDQLVSDFRSLATHAEELMRATSSMSSETLTALRARLGDSLRDAREQLASAEQYAMERGRQAVVATDTYVHEKPWQAIAVAALVGVLLGFMSSGSKR